MALSIASAPAMAANDGSINFTGELTTTTCKVEGQPPGGDTVNKQVPMGLVPVATLAAAGSVATGKYFDIKVGGTGDTGCTDGVKAKVRFDPRSPLIDGTTGALNIDPTGTAATNVQIRLYDMGSTTPLHLLNDESRPVEIASNQATLPFVAEYFSAAGGATAGTANSTVGFQVVYE